MMCLKIVVLMFFITLVAAGYWLERSRIIQRELKQSLGWTQFLNEKEKRVNEILLEYKYNEMDRGFKNPGSYPPAMHFFQAKPLIEKSVVFKIIRLMPKGASLHSHYTALASNEFLYNLTYSNGLKACVKDGQLFFRYHVHPGDDCHLSLVSELRLSNSSFDDFIKSQISMVVDNPHEAYPDINAAWKKFSQVGLTVKPMLRNLNTVKLHLRQALEELREDNVFYLEFKGGVHSVFDNRGKIYDGFHVISKYRDIIEDYKHDHPDFFGARIILSEGRRLNQERIADFITVVKKLKTAFPDFVAGYDLNGQEDEGEPLIKFIPQLMKLSKIAKSFFHAGETNWHGMSADLNLLDAVLLNATRIGHGYALVKHNEILKLVRKRHIAIEVCPISNQVLKLVDDFRNHPAAILMNLGIDVVICNDDPGLWGSRGLSYDWYLAFMAMTSRGSDLRFLKQLAINSIKFSAMNGAEKLKALTLWKTKWDDFLDKILIAKNFQNMRKFIHW